MSSFGPLSKQSLVAVQIASAESRALKHFYLGVEHLTIGLCKVVDSELEAIMREAGFDAQGFRRRLRAVAAGGAEPVWGSQLLVTPRVGHVMRLAEQIAERLQKAQVRPTHLLMAVLAEGQSLPVRVLDEPGWDRPRLETRLLEHLGGKSSQPAGGAALTRTPCLDAFGRDLTAEAREGKLRPAIGRKAELLALVQILARQTKNNPLLVGEPGVGKTCLVEALAQRAVRDDAPEPLRGKRVVEVPMGPLVGGAWYRGAFEERLEALIKEATAHPEVILFLDEVHTLVGAGAAGAGSLDAANILKPALGRGDIHCIGATTEKEYRLHIERDAALERRFEVVRIGEPSQEETLEILAGLQPSLESHHGLSIEREALHEAVRLGARFLPDRRFPDKAVDLVDRACSQKRLQSLTVIDRQPRPGPVTKADIAQVVSQKTGVPVGSLTGAEAETLRHLEERLRQRVVGQDEAVRLVAEAVIEARQLGHHQRPSGVFLFLGPTGVGKTELAKALAAALFGSDGDLLRFDMSEYGERHSVSRLLGAPPSYVGYDEGGQLTEAVRRRPYSVLLFDEVEKAHPDVVNVFLQLFDDGRLTDGHGRTVDFSNTLVIMTSNLGSEGGGEAQRGVGFRARQEVPAVEQRETYLAAVRRAVTQAFRPEFVNRIDELVVFNSLSAENLGEIVVLLLREVEAQVAERGLQLEVTDEVRDLLIEEGYSPIYGARELRRAVQRLVRKPLSQFLLRETLPAGTTVRVLRSDKETQFQLVLPEGKP